jgi:hypothetical protein
MLSNWMMRDAPVVNMSWRVPRSMEQEMDDFFDEHEQFMRRTHTMMAPKLMGAASLADDTLAPRLSEFYVSKGPEQKNALESTPEDTGNLLYNRTDAFVDPAGVERSLSLLESNWPEGWNKLRRYNNDFGITSNLGNLRIIGSMEDRIGEVKVERGHSVNSMTWCVPKVKEKEMDEFLASHEKWMRSTHEIGEVGGAPPKDKKKIRVTNFLVAKGPELVDPNDKSKGETENLIYTISETFPDADGSKRHVELAKQTWPGGWEKLKKYNSDYGIMTNISSSKVITSRF